MYILGVSAFYHDSAAVLVKDGEVLCAAEEERFSRIKHDNEFPFKAIGYCLKKEGIQISAVDYVAYYEKPLLKFERILEDFVSTYPKALRPFIKSIGDWLSNKIKVEQIIKKKVGFKGEIFFIPHHLSHASAGFFPSPFGKAAVLTADGVGEYQTTGLWLGEKNRLKPLKSIDFPHSLGLLYSTFTAFLGFRVNEDEYKMMGLAAYGKPTLKNKIYQVVDIAEDGSFNLNMKYFAFRESFKMWNKNFEKLFGLPRSPKDPVTKRDKNLAASIQAVTEEIYFKVLNYLYQLAKTPNLCLSGGVVLNALANGKIYTQTPFKNVYIFGAAGDSGSALGAALFTYHSIRNKKKRYPIHDLCLGSSYSNEEIERVLIGKHLKYQRLDTDKIAEKVAILLSKNHIVGWFEGKMEFGPRALGARSILANPKPRFMKDKVNRIKIRELFRPFAGSVLQEKVSLLFDVPGRNHASPFMIFCFMVKKDKREDISAIVHKDYSCRIQTVNEDNGIYYKVIKKFEELTGVPCILNTSFNLKGEPIVETPDQAVDDFLKTKMEALAIGNFFILKPNCRG